MAPSTFTTHALDVRHSIKIGRLPDYLLIAGANFETLWAQYPAVAPTIRVHGWVGPAPRWKQAYDRNYTFSGQTSHALPLPILKPVVIWARQTIDPGLNGALVNCYDAAHGHYVGAHREKVRDLVAPSPIVTISFGDPRTFRVRPYGGAGYEDIETTPGLTIVMPWAMHRNWTHDVPKTARPGPRISLTLRCFAGPTPIGVRR
jgi:alkylated DNA repair dioxygenase AlkB